jgi:uncharacterized membrane protein
MEAIKRFMKAEVSYKFTKWLGFTQFVIAGVILLVTLANVDNMSISQLITYIGGSLFILILGVHQMLEGKIVELYEKNHNK